ncbi:MAG: membrane protein insertase YidC [Chitinophagaceae bacterium]|nr:membrane protein insertase YidC [Chitinophagaceae bacterium]MBK7679091.1 membrane protein insertase YidC [Chitinophagaceae bacterium]MBK8299564.1 membrane protein insertase YidC [Chitinophagaceae bacterium]MBK9463614.1 membrane protein insertase YidC [Chitinophagaceae bacterium]MBK9659265.1 membrane protein insertase YidC [Chitinophagaceae bacterium]
MKFDRNTVLGFIVLAGLFFGYFYFTNQQQSEYRKQKAAEAKLTQAKEDSIAKLNKPLQDSLNKIKDSVVKKEIAGIFQDTTDGTEQLVTLQNELIKVTFTNKGGQPAKVELKNFKGQDSNLLKLASTDFDKIGYTINTGKSANGGSAQTSDLYFSQVSVDTSSTGGNKTVSFTLNSSDSSGSYITHEYTLKPNEYMVDFNVKMNGANTLLTQGTMNLSWQYAAAQQESDISFEKQNTQVGYVKDGSFDYHTIGRKSSKNFDESVNWIGVRQRFFFTILVAKDNFTSGKMEWTVPDDSTKTIVQSTANMRLSVKAGSPTIVPFSLYYGPSDYHILQKYDMKFEKLVNLGQGIYSFVRPINKYVILPIFDFLKSIAGGMGLAIALLTIFIKLVTSPLLYKSYLSGAKMKVLRPEIAKLKEKHGEDRQAMSMDQMKLFREAGVNPLGGCLPALLQIPIFFALFSLFNADVGLRGAEFLWSHDLSAFDAPIKFGFHIPLLGSHLSLFNITAVLTSFLISIYSMSMTPDQSNPVMKYLPYIFPVFLLFFFNRLPSALTWYYTVSNVVTLALQFVIQNYIIDHKKILDKIDQNRKKPKTKSKWQERMEQMQEQQKKMKEMQQKNRR